MRPALVCGCNIIRPDQHWLVPISPPSRYFPIIPKPGILLPGSSQMWTLRDEKMAELICELPGHRAWRCIRLFYRFSRRRILFPVSTAAEAPPSVLRLIPAKPGKQPRTRIIVCGRWMPGGTSVTADTPAASLPGAVQKYWRRISISVTFICDSIGTVAYFKCIPKWYTPP